MKSEIEIVDRGRGLQLSTSRITVQDLVPYFQEGNSYEEILHWIPTLSRAEIAVVERYYRAHQVELDDQDRRIRERALQRKNPPAIEDILLRGAEKMAALREEFAKQRLERNGDNAPG
jgi:uncharacterized protein (DUF433 family)